MATLIIAALLAGNLFYSSTEISYMDRQSEITSCDIEVILSAKSLPMHSYVLNSLGDLEENAEILEPITVDDGTYSVYVTRKGSDLYKVDGQNIYVKTSYCYEYVYYQDAYLDLMKVQNIMMGEITFR